MLHVSIRSWTGMVPLPRASNHSSLTGSQATATPGRAGWVLRPLRCCMAMAAFVHTPPTHAVPQHMSTIDDATSAMRSLHYTLAVCGDSTAALLAQGPYIYRPVL